MAAAPPGRDREPLLPAHDDNNGNQSTLIYSYYIYLEKLKSFYLRNCLIDEIVYVVNPFTQLRRVHSR